MASSTQDMQQSVGADRNGLSSQESAMHDTLGNAQVEQRDQSKGHPTPGPMVNITINGQSKSIHRGHQTVIAIKTLGGVPLADDLEHVVDGKLVLLPDDGAVTIKGEEVFVSHPKDSASSAE